MRKLYLIVVTDKSEFKKLPTEWAICDNRRLQKTTLKKSGLQLFMALVVLKFKL